MGPAVFTSHEDICSVPLYFSEIFAKKGNVTGFRRVLIVKCALAVFPRRDIKTAACIGDRGSYFSVKMWR